MGADGGGGGGGGVSVSAALKTLRSGLFGCVFIMTKSGATTASWRVVLAAVIRFIQMFAFITSSVRAQRRGRARAWRWWVGRRCDLACGVARELGRIRMAGLGSENPRARARWPQGTRRVARAAVCLLCSHQRRSGA